MYKMFLEIAVLRMVAFFGLDEKAHPKNALHSSDVRLLINEQTVLNTLLSPN